MQIDFHIVDHGSVVSIQPMTDAGKEWLAEHVVAESWSWIGPRLYCDHRMVEPILQHIEADGLAY